MVGDENRGTPCARKGKAQIEDEEYRPKIVIRKNEG